MRSPRVSVVIPCYNLGKYIDEAVESVLSQTYQDFEIIIVNDGSTDEYTNNLLRNYNRAKTQVITTDNQGLPRARNNGIERASGEYILPLDADDKIEPAFLEKTVEVLNDNPEIDFVYTSVKIFGEKEQSQILNQFDVKRLLIGNYIYCSALFRKKTWKKVNGYKSDPDLYGYEDWDFWLTLAEKGGKGYCISEELFLYRYRHNSMNRITSLPENYIKVVEKICLNHKNLYQKYIDYLIPTQEKTIQDKEKIISDLYNIILDKDRAIQDKDRAISDMEKIIMNKDETILNMKETIFNNEKAILNMKAAICNKKNAIVDLQNQLRNIREARVYKAYKKIKYVMERNRLTRPIFMFLRRRWLAK